MRRRVVGRRVVGRQVVRRSWLLAGLVAAQLAVGALVLGPSLLARTTGTEVVLRVEPRDPVDPMRGAYLALAYPDLPDPSSATPDGARVWVRLVEQDGVWVGSTPVTGPRPTGTPYLACRASWRLECGLDSWFTDQATAARLEDELAAGGLATVRVDGRGRAVLVDVRGAGRRPLEG